MPLGLLAFVWWTGELSGQHLAYAVVAALVLYLFVTMLGIHCGVNYANGRAAILTSLGTVFFLCLGIAICMVIMVSFRGSVSATASAVFSRSSLAVEPDCLRP